MGCFWLCGTHILRLAFDAMDAFAPCYLSFEVLVYGSSVTNNHMTHTTNQLHTPVSPLTYLTKRYHHLETETKKRKPKCDQAKINQLLCILTDSSPRAHYGHGKLLLLCSLT